MWKRSNWKRVIWDVIVFVGLLVFVLLRGYEWLPIAFGDVIMKAIYVSLGFLHAHITRKLAFPHVNWEEEELNAKAVLVIALYVVIIFAYARGG